MRRHNHEHSSDRMVLVGRHAALFDGISGVALGWLYRAVAAKVVTALPPGGSLLDVGTGPGRLLLEIAGRRPDAHLVGVDPSPDMVGHAERRAAAEGLSERIEVRTAAAEDLPFADETVDVVVSTLSAHHWADTAVAVAEQARVLRPGGELWVVDLRRSSDALDKAMRAQPLRAIQRPRVSLIGSAVLVTHRAEKPRR